MFKFLRHEQVENCKEISGKSRQVLVRKHKFRSSIDDSDDVNKVLFSSACNIKDHAESCSCNFLEGYKEQKRKSFELSDSEESFNISNIKSMTDDEWLKSKFKHVVELNDCELFDSNLEKQLNAGNAFEKNISESCFGNSKLSLKNEILLSGRLFVRNLPYSISENELRDVFEKFGKIINVCFKN